MVTIMDTPDSEPVSALALADVALGNVETITLRACDRDEMTAVIRRLESA
jgi:uncharacterized protein with GYD domain